MLLEAVKKEFLFDCECRNLSEKTIQNYARLLDYLFDYLKTEHEITEVIGTTSDHIKGFLVKMQRMKCSVNYQNDLLNARVSSKRKTKHNSCMH